MNAPHNPGGKSRLRLADGVTGDAMFAGPNGEYRLILTRKWINLFNPHTRLPNNFVMWICMNPSVADANVDDPTVNRIIDFSMGWDFDGMVLVNCCDLRATKPEALLEPGVVPCSKGNLPLIRSTAKEAQRIVCAWGNLHRELVHHAINVESALRADRHTLYCLGTNAGGSPKHPLYVRGDTPLTEFKGVPA
ncbi:DUF1643 domain-containing protein [Bradyrhizobium barranii subsp. apii]|uniref:DUF1643 domain-containing protein n=1 Tax=Bradyrhizobium barranii TaxID=2992140 RepID=UPI001AA1CD68|nr:DUF1643 domain-containing protein [Bradyrhizobium barranii]UPT99301.1 DUF1643 domain-containing protein [Bradyrhizobium barranii subsp. apii]